MKNLRIKAVRAGMDLSQEKLAELMGVIRQIIRMMEMRRYDPALSLCMTIRKALHKTLDELFWGEQQEV